jgi:carbamoyltransferase
MGLSAYAEPDKNLVQFFTEYYESYSQYTREEFLRLKYTLNKNLTERRKAPGITNVYYRYPTMIADLEHTFIKKLWQLKQRTDAKVLAASVQEFAENKILEIMRTARKHGSKLIYSGGVAQNIVANSKIRDMFDDMHIAIAPSDCGSSLGCAAKTWAEQTGGKRLNWSPYLGYDIKNKINPKEVVDYLLSKRVCGIANGKAEFGPRALGNRSLIADVRYDVKDTVNDIKKRERFRPFAPAILEEYADEYFDGHKNEYMQYTCKAKHDYNSVIHIDGTSRCQVVKKDCQSILRQILEEYYERTGVPMLLNTSLNIKGQPMLNDEQDVEKWQSKYNVRIF